MITRTQLETEVLPQIVHRSPHQSTAIEKQRRIIEWVIWLSIAFGVGHADVLLALLDEALPQPVFEVARTCALLTEQLLHAWDDFRPCWQFFLDELAIRLLEASCRIVHHIFTRFQAVIKLDFFFFLFIFILIALVVDVIDGDLVQSDFKIGSAIILLEMVLQTARCSRCSCLNHLNVI